MIPFPLPTFIPRYLSPNPPLNWFGHLAFAHDLVTAIRPSLYVALNASTGDAYFGVCQTVLERGLACTCYSVLSLVDDQDASDPAELTSYNASHYDSFSHLLSSGEDSILRFSDNSIDILQIGDGERAAQVFEAWLPKVKPGGVILIDQIANREGGTEVWCLWEDIEHSFQDWFAFHHANGLGVVRRPGSEAAHSSFLESLFNSSADIREYTRRHYVIYSGYLDGILRRDNATEVLNGRIDALNTEVLAGHHERMILEAALTQLQLEVARARFNLHEVADLKASLAAAHSAHEATRIEKRQLTEALQAERQTTQDLVHSLSWRITAPVREFMGWVRNRKAD